MFQYILRRLALLIPVLLGVSLVVFTLIRLIPGDATLLAIGVDTRITPEQRELVRKSYGLDQPPPVQYLRWLEHVVQGEVQRVARSSVASALTVVSVAVCLSLWSLRSLVQHSSEADVRRVKR